MQIFVVRVATDDNIADLPSRRVRHRFVRCRMFCAARQDFQLLREMSATEVEPCLKKELSDAESWAILQERWRLC